MQYEFTSPYSLKECIERLTTLKSSYDAQNNFLFSTRINILPVDNTQLDYSIHIWKYLNHVAEVSGSLMENGDTTTGIDGQTKTNLRFRILVGVALVIGPVFGVLALSRGDVIGVSFALLWMGVICLNQYRVNRWQRELITILHDTLTI